MFLLTPDALRTIILMKMMKAGGVYQIQYHVCLEFPEIEECQQAEGPGPIPESEPEPEPMDGQVEDGGGDGGNDDGGSPEDNDQGNGDQDEDDDE